MKKNLLDILSNSSKEADNQKIMDYLSGKLPEWEKNEVERWLAEESDLGDDALEGIMKLEGDETVRKNVDLLNPVLDYIPSEYISIVISNIGPHNTSEIQKLVFEFYCEE